MRRTLISILALSVVLGVDARPRAVRPAPSPLPLIVEVDQVAAAALESGIPGFVVAVAYGDRILFERAYGSADRSGGTALGTDTIFQIASVSKQFTAAAIMKLVERGELTLDTDIRELIPEVRTGDWKVTVEHLLTHTGGLPNYIEGTWDPHEPVTHAEVFAALNERSMRFRPGDRYEYNNAGYYLLGVIIERLSGQAYAEFLETEFFHPLGLVETAYCGRPPAWPVPNGYVEIPPLAPVAFEAMDMSIPFAAGALCSTAEDLVRWSAALAQGRAVNLASFEAMTTRYRLNGGGSIGYGYGLGIGRWQGMDIVSHNGGIPGFSSFLMTLPETGYTIAVVANLFSTERAPAAEIGIEIAERMHD